MRFTSDVFMQRGENMMCPKFSSMKANMSASNSIDRKNITLK